MKKYTIVFLLFLIAGNICAQSVIVQIDAAQGRKPISPYIYGKNNNISDDPSSPTSASEWELMRDAGLRFARENGGNNASKYNWRLKLSSHPDWYNNIYYHNWDYSAKTLGDSMPGVQGMWAFQLIGKAAANNTNNFNDWAYNNSNWWSGTCQNLAGGGTPNAGGGCAATTSGNTNLYLENWTADSTVGILDHWFGGGSLGYDPNKIRYWSMDNEPDIWNSTHDDVIPTQPTAEALMQLYFSVAKKARAKYPNIKLTGPVPCSEWQWYSWNNSKINYNGQDYVWLQYFIKRCAEEQLATGIRLVDVIDIHSYPNENSSADILQGHRIYFDTTYNYPGANGVKTTSASGWDNSITKEYIFGRVNKWLTQYMGANHGVTCGISEFGATNINANVTANSYASLLGTFADNNVEFFSPWFWYPGMWETMHLFSRYAKSTRVRSVSSNETDVSAYSSVNSSNDSMTIILVNRSISATHNTTINLSNFSIPNGSYTTKRLSSLPSGETFVSHTNNALQNGTATVSSNSLTVSLPPLSITTILLHGNTATSITDLSEKNIVASLYPNPVSGMNAFVGLNSEISNFKVELFNLLGELVYTKIYRERSGFVIEIPTVDLEKGIYMVKLSAYEGNWTSKFIKM